MSRLTLRLPDPLHKNLAAMAQAEGVSLNHYIVYSLTKTVAALNLEQQRADFERLTSRYPKEEAEAALREVLSAREP